MFALFINPENQMPTTVSLNTRHYAELKMKGYSEVLIGSKRNMLDREKELMEELNLTDLDITEIQND